MQKMNKIIYFLAYCLLFVNCQSQKNNQNLDKNQEITFGHKSYLFGNWKLIERNYWDGEVKKTYPLHECEKKYTLSFEKNETKIFLIKNYVDGKNCERKSNSGKILVSINDGFFSYLEGDLKRNEYYKIEPKNKFSIIYNEILEGKVRKIEDVYERFNER